MKVRFAPSPTGYIHVGNCRTALINWLFARKNGGTFLLRLDDTDTERCEKKYEEALYEDWKWLGLDFDEEARQSNRLALYEEALEKLKAMGRLYPCYETKEELEFKRKMALKKGLPPLYDREALTLSEDQIKTFEAEGRKPHWRFKLDDTPIEWVDLARGPIHFEGSKLSDPILVRENGSFIYTIASVVDDIDLNITHILRGEDHVSNTAIQIQLFEALGADPKKIHFAHLPLLAGEKGEALGKRLGSLSIRDLRSRNILPMALNSLLGKIGTSDAIQPFPKMEDLLESFDLSKFARSTPKFSEEQLEQLNAKLLHQLSLKEAQQLCNLPEMTDHFWQTVRANVQSFSEVRDWWDICHNSKGHKVEDQALIQSFIQNLPEEPWTEESWSQWIKSVKEETGKKGKALFMPLRLALTGQEHGPELKTLFLLLGKDKLIQKLST